MKNKINNSIPAFNSLEEEREYWEERGPLTKGKRGQLNREISKQKRASFISVRLTGSELTKLRDIANEYNSGPSTFARNMILLFLDRIEGKKEQKEKGQAKYVNFEELIQSVAEKMPESYKKQFSDLFISSVAGNIEDPSILIMDQAQMHEMRGITENYLKSLVRTINPNILFVTPSDEYYKKIKASVTKKQSEDNKIKT